MKEKFTKFVRRTNRPSYSPFQTIWRPFSLSQRERAGVRESHSSENPSLPKSKLMRAIAAYRGRFFRKKYPQAVSKFLDGDGLSSSSPDSVASPRPLRLGVRNMFFYQTNPFRKMHNPLFFNWKQKFQSRSNPKTNPFRTHYSVEQTHF
jgi:hypothetical protein